MIEQLSKMSCDFVDDQRVQQWVRRNELQQWWSILKATTSILNENMEKWTTCSSSHGRNTVTGGILIFIVWSAKPCQTPNPSRAYHQNGPNRQERRVKARCFSCLKRFPKVQGSIPISSLFFYLDLSKSFKINA